MSRKLTWLARWLCTVLALVLVFWWRPDVETKDRVAAEGSGPRVTKPYPRDRDPRMEKRAKNPREEYDAARKRGLTEEEVRLVVEEFLAMDLNSWRSVQRLTPPEDTHEDWKRLEQWYLDTLVSGFGLSKQQKEQAATKLRQLGERRFSEYQEFLAIRNEEASNGVKLPDGYELVFSGPDSWLRTEAPAPWNLLDLDEDQREITGYGEGEGQSVWRKMTKDFGTD